MRSKTEHELTSLSEIIREALSKSDDIQEIESQIYQKKLKLLMIETKPALCLSDLKHSIQAVENNRLKKQVNLLKLCPFNKRLSVFYQFDPQKKWIHLNCSEDKIGQIASYPNAYEPSFHFGPHYQRFKKEKRNMNYQAICYYVKIKKWSLKIINVGSSGYYGVILCLHEYKTVDGEDGKEKLDHVSSVLYENWMQVKMQKLRLKDIKNAKKDQNGYKSPYSLFYHTMYHKDQKKHVNIQNIFYQDKSQKMLTYQKGKQLNYVCLGNMKGICSLIEPIDKKQFDYETKKNENWQKIISYFTNLSVKQINKKKQGNDENILWSSQDEEQQKSSSNQIQQNEEKDQSSDSQEDPLRALYMKKFEKKQIL